MIDVNKKMAEIRQHADSIQENAKKVRGDAAKLYATVDRLWAAKITAEKIRGELMRKGYVKLEPDLINQVVNDSLEVLINGGHLNA